MRVKELPPTWGTSPWIPAFAGSLARRPCGGRERIPPPPPWIPHKRSATFIHRGLAKGDLCVTSRGGPGEGWEGEAEPRLPGLPGAPPLDSRLRGNDWRRRQLCRPGQCGGELLLAEGGVWRTPSGVCAAPCPGKRTWRLSPPRHPAHVNPIPAFAGMTVGWRCGNGGYAKASFRGNDGGG